MPHPIDLIDPQLLKIAAPENDTLHLAGWADPIKLGCQRFGIDTVREIAALLAQAAHESCGFTRLSENLNYTNPQRIKDVFGQGHAGRLRFPTLASCQPYCRNPERLANYVYANRMGNGPPASGDGWRFRGCGPFQLTGRNNYQAFADAVGMEVEEVPDYVRSQNGGAMSMCWFFKVNGLEDLAATPGVADETRAINGGLIGLPDRKRRFDLVVAEMIRRGA
jgi:putative chitinase